MARSTARKRALNTLYEADEKGQDFLSLLDERINHPGAQTPLPDYAIRIVRGVAEHRRMIDRALDAHSTRWPLSRMHVIDRNLLRIATWEMLYNPEVPDKVAIDEALSLAKTLSDSDAPSFIHGLLSAVEKDRDQLNGHDQAGRVRYQEVYRAEGSVSDEPKTLQKGQVDDVQQDIARQEDGQGVDCEINDGGESDNSEANQVSLADLTLSLPDELSDTDTRAD